MKKQQPGAVDFGLLFILSLIWGGAFMLSKVAVQDMAPVTLTAIRQVIASAMFGAILLAGSKLAAANGRDHLLIVLSAVFGSVLPFSFITWGVARIDSGLAAILMGTMPLVTLVLAHFATQDEQLTPRKLVSVLIGFSGLVLLFAPSLSGDGLTAEVIAMLVVSAAAVCYAINSIMTKKLTHLPLRQVMGYSIFWSAAMLIPGALLLEGMPQQMPGTASALAIFLLALGPTVIGAIILFKLISRQGAGFFGQINLLVPATGVLWGAVILDERIAPYQWAALMIILAGVALSRGSKVGAAP